ncbi:nitrate- and nitrite sensing domain-containing protein [Streptosporangium soli]|nr:nitrate- and nitrite sensing domain-containing protein [Streptosporangium sp. KLBMP 9127]
MRFRKSRMGTKIIALLVSLAALWAFAAWVTLREGMNLLWVSRLDAGVAAPSVRLLEDLQLERRLSLIKLGDPARAQREALAEQRRRTDASLRNFEELTGGTDVQWAASQALLGRIDEADQRLTLVRGTRKAVDAGSIDQRKAATTYNDAADFIFYIYQSLATLDDDSFAKDTRALINLYRAREMLAREDAHLAGALAAGQFGSTEYTQFVQLVGAQRHLSAEALGDLRDADPAAHGQVVKSGVLNRVRSMEELVIGTGSNGASPPVSGEQWQAVTKPALTELQQAVDVAGDRLVDRATPIAAGVILRLALAGGLGLLAVVASIVLSITTARALVRQLDKLRVAASELARERLPDVVNRLGHGEKVDIAAEAPPLAFGDDQIGQVGRAFNEVQETAIRVAVEQAELRRSIREVLLSLARRTQSLVHRQLALLDTMERRESDPKDLKDLFRVDHLATRMRRNAENLIVLSGASPARSWRRPVPMIDVVRGALAEVEDYTRVTVPPMGDVSLAGRAVGDVIHLLAELIENAVSYSPPYTTAEVVGQVVGSGYVIEIEDRGLGMSPEDLDAANERITNPPEFDLRDTSRLGLFVVSRLADRHGIRVSLKGSPYGGTTAVILLPNDIVIGEGDEERGPETDPGTLLPVPAEGALWNGDDAKIARRTAALGEWTSMSEQSVKPVLAAIPDPVQPAREQEPPPDDSAFTPSGLPFRVPQASLAPALRTDGPPPAEEPTEDERSPEEIRRIMGAYQAGTARGREEALGRHASDDRDPR